MQYQDLIKKRRSNRSYKTDMIPDDKMKKLYEALQIAPSGSNKQDFKFIFVTDTNLRKEIAQKACHQDFIQEAPILMIAVCKKGYEFNTAIAVDHMILQATDIGLGTCWINWFGRDLPRELLNIPDELSIPIMVSIGYANDAPDAKSRKNIDQLICHNKY